MTTEVIVPHFRDEDRQVQLALNHMSQGLCMLDGQNRVVMTNHHFRVIYSLTEEESRPGTHFNDLIKNCQNNGLQPVGNSAIHSLDEDTDFIQVLNDGRAILVSQRRLSGSGCVTTYTDITKEQKAEQKLLQIAHYDTLTGVANRRLALERIELALKNLRRGEAVAVLFLDLDRFKNINDSFGHAAGDELLQAVAGRLTKSVRATDMVARLAGDEFAILCVGSDQPNGAAALAERVSKVLRAPFNIGNQIVRTSASIGIAVGPSDGQTTSEILRCADLALYSAKAQCRGTYRFFEPRMADTLRVRTALEQSLRIAVAAESFALHYQPIVAVSTNQVRCFEALIRWHDPEHGMVPPSDFIPIAEECGLIVPIGNWVARRACLDALNWPEHISVGVNLSRVQLSTQDLSAEIMGILAETGLPPSRLQLEITETAVMSDIVNAVYHLRKLRDMGVQIAIDDFGKGESSLSCLRSFPFNRLKIDRSFVNDLAVSAEARVVFSAIIKLADALGLRTIAEGVETQEQMDIVRAEGCCEMQGYLISRPRPAAEIESYLQVPDRISLEAA